MAGKLMGGCLGTLLSQREYARIMRLVMGEWGKSEDEVLEWISDDDSPTWAGDPWSTQKPL